MVSITLSPVVRSIRSIRSTHEAPKASVLVVSRPTPGTEPIQIEASSSSTNLDFTFTKEVGMLQSAQQCSELRAHLYKEQQEQQSVKAVG